MAIATEVVTSVSLSGSTNYQGFAVNDNATKGKIIHTSSSTSGVLDEVWFWVCNVDNSAAKLLTIEVAASSGGAIDAVFEYTVPFEGGLFLAVPGWTLQNGALIRAFGPATDDFIGFGYVNRIT